MKEWELHSHALLRVLRDGCGESHAARVSIVIRMSRRSRPALRGGIPVAAVREPRDCFIDMCILKVSIR